MILRREPGPVHDSASLGGRELPGQLPPHSRPAARDDGQPSLEAIHLVPS